MKKVTLLFLLATLFLFTLAANAGDVLYFYGGDFDNNNPNAHGLANETDGTIPGSPYGAASLQNFVVSGSSVTVTGLFTNDLMDISPTTAYWEIRSGVSEGNGGTLIASGDGIDTVTATGRSRNGRNEYTNFVGSMTDLGLNVTLAPGTYWFLVVPEDPNSPAGRSFLSNSLEGLNAVGTQISNEQFFDSPAFGAVYTNANNELADAFPTFSAGVWVSGGGGVPEPGTLVMMGTGVLGLAGVIRRKLSL